MIQITPQTRIMVAIEPVDFRWGIDSLSRLVRDQLKFARLQLAALIYTVDGCGVGCDLFHTATNNVKLMTVL